MRPIHIFATVLLPLAASAQQASSTAALLTQLRTTKHVGAVALSPDGKLLAMDADGKLTIAPIGKPEAGHPVSVCADGQGSISGLSWSPDNSTLAILADCAGGPRISTADTNAKVRTLATLHGFAEGLTYTPDGKSLGLLYVEGATRHSGALAAMKPPSGEIGVEGLEIQRVATVDTATGALKQVTPPSLHVYEFSFSPDSSKLAYVAAAPPGENNWWIAKLYTQPVAGSAEPKVVLDPHTVPGPLHGLQIAVPRWSPNGGTLALIGGLMSDQGATGGDLYVLPSNGDGPPVNLTAGAKTTVQWIEFLPNGRLLATEIAGGSERVDELSLLFPPDFKAPGGAKIGVTNRLTDRVVQTLPYSIGDGRFAGSFAVSEDGSVAAWAASSFSQAPEVFAGPLNGQALPAVTHLNAALKPSWGKAESVTWTNENYNVQGWLLYPPDYDPARKYGLIVMVHGGPSSAITPHWPRAGFGAAPLAASGYFVLQPNPRGSYGEGETFTAANKRDFGYGDLRDILAGVDAVEKQIPAIDDNRLGLTGWSYGGFMTMFGVTQTTRFKAAVAGAGISDWQSYYGENSIDQWMTPFFGATVYKEPAVYAKSSAIQYIDRVKTPTLVVVGDRDGECPAPQSFEFWHALKAENVPTTLVVYPDEGHGFVNPDHQRDVMERSIRWFGEYLK